MNIWQKSLDLSVEAVFALLILPGRPSIVFAVRGCPVDTRRHKKTSYFRRRSCVRVIDLSRVGQVLSRCPQMSSGHLQA